MSESIELFTISHNRLVRYTLPNTLSLSSPKMSNHTRKRSHGEERLRQSNKRRLRQMGRPATISSDEEDNIEVIPVDDNRDSEDEYADDPDEDDDACMNDEEDAAGDSIALGVNHSDGDSCNEDEDDDDDSFIAPDSDEDSGNDNHSHRAADNMLSEMLDSHKSVKRLTVAPPKKKNKRSSTNQPLTPHPKRAEAEWVRRTSKKDRPSWGNPLPSAEDDMNVYNKKRQEAMRPPSTARPSSSTRVKKQTVSTAPAGKRSKDRDHGARPRTRDQPVESPRRQRKVTDSRRRVDPRVEIDSRRRVDPRDDAEFDRMGEVNPYRQNNTSSESHSNVHDLILSLVRNQDTVLSNHISVQDETLKALKLLTAYIIDRFEKPLTDDPPQPEPSHSEPRDDNVEIGKQQRNLLTKFNVPFPSRTSNTLNKFGNFGSPRELAWYLFFYRTKNSWVQQSYARVNREDIPLSELLVDMKNRFRMFVTRIWIGRQLINSLSIAAKHIVKDINYLISLKEQLPAMTYIQGTFDDDSFDTLVKYITATAKSQELITVRRRIARLSTYYNLDELPRQPSEDLFSLTSISDFPTNKLFGVLPVKSKNRSTTTDGDQVNKTTRQRTNGVDPSSDSNASEGSEEEEDVSGEEEEEDTPDGGRADTQPDGGRADTQPDEEECSQVPLEDEEYTQAQPYPDRDISSDSSDTDDLPDAVEEPAKKKAPTTSPKPVEKSKHIKKTTEKPTEQQPKQIVSTNKPSNRSGTRLTTVNKQNLLPAARPAQHKKAVVFKTPLNQERSFDKDAAPNTVKGSNVTSVGTTPMSTTPGHTATTPDEEAEILAAALDYDEVDDDDDDDDVAATQAKEKQPTSKPHVHSKNKGGTDLARAFNGKSKDKK